MKRRSYIDIGKRPYDLLGVTALLLFLMSFVLSNSAMDINLHDTYVVIAHMHLCWFFSGALLFLWSMGILFRNYIWSVTLSWIQVVLTLLSVITFIKLAIGTGLDGIPRRYYAFSEFNQSKQWFSTASAYVFMLLLIVIGQIVFVVNVIGGLLRKVLNSAPSNQQKTT
ncbi:hypothetical protein ACFGVR_00105 [Mucilaginibacter sp. AW1-3]